LAVVTGSERKAFLTWKARGEARIADHTFVPPDGRGQGIAGQLLDALIADAREQGYKIVPHRSYVVAAFRRHPEWAALLADTSG
jgi:predicted GNAT family acetyltransferase